MAQRNSSFRRLRRRRHHHHHRHQWIYNPYKVPWPPHTRSFVILLRHLIRLLWTSYQSVAKASTYTGQHKDKYPCPSRIRTRDPSNEATNDYTLDRSATGIGISSFT
jgi:hypothetical protein